MRSSLLLLVTAAPLLTACRGTPPEQVRVDGRPLSEWIAASVDADHPPAERVAWQALRRAGTPAVPALRHAMERTTDPERRARIGLVFTFLCPSTVSAMREEARTAQGDVQTQLEMAAQAMAAQAQQTGTQRGTDGC